jgi:hypothetical protein
MIVWSLLFNEDGLQYVLITARGYYVIGLFYLLGKNIKSINPIFELDNPIYYVNLSAIFIALLIPTLKHNYSVVYFILVLTLFVAIMSGSRRALLVASSAFIIGLSINAIYSNNITFKLLPVLFIIFIILIRDYIFNIIIWLASTNDLIYNRIVEKTIESIEYGGSYGDLTRMEYIFSTPVFLVENIIPKGFLTKNPNVSGTGLFMDFPLYELFYTFGSLTTILILIILVKKILYKIIFIKKLKKRHNNIAYFIPLINILFLSFLFYDGGFLIWTYNTIFTGLFLGLLFNNNIMNENK